MNKKEEYAKLWKKDSYIMNEHELYDWMANHIEKYKTVLEIGCGAGFSTLSLLKRNHNVICIETNSELIKECQALLKHNGYENVEFINERISEINCLEVVKRINDKIDIVICWNPGGLGMYTNDETNNIIIELLELGYPISNNMEENLNLYSEDLIKSTCTISKYLKADVHVIDRCDANEDTTDFNLFYQNDLKKEFDFNDVKIDRIEGIGNKFTMNSDKNLLYNSYLLSR